MNIMWGFRRQTMIDNSQLFQDLDIQGIEIEKLEMKYLKLI